MEVDFGFGGRFMCLRDEPQLQRPTRLGEDLGAAFSDMVAHRGIRQACRAVGKSPGVVELWNRWVIVAGLLSGVSLPVLGWAIA